VTPAPASATRLSVDIPPSDRDSLLERLRARAKSLDATDVQRILSSRRGA
jgi:hypothetical protein